MTAQQDAIAYTYENVGLGPFGDSRDATAYTYENVGLGPLGTGREAIVYTYEAVLPAETQQAFAYTYETTVRPGNIDNFADRRVLDPAGDTDYLDNTGFTTETDELDQPYYTAWYEWTPGAGQAIVDVQTGSRIDAAGRIYKRTNALLPVALNNLTDISFAFDNSYTFIADGSTTYYIQVGSWSTYNSTGGIVVTVAGGTPPTYLDRSATLTRSRSVQAAGTTQQAIDASATLTRSRSFQAAGITQNMVAGSATLNRSRTLEAAAGSYNIPANDDIANADVLVGLTGTDTYSTVGARLESGEPALVDSVEDKGTVWFSWTPSTDVDATFTTDPTQHLDAFIDPNLGRQPWLGSLDQLPIGSSLDWVYFDYNGDGWYAGSYVKLYSVTTLIDLTTGSNFWGDLHSTPDNIARSAGETMGTDLELDLFVGVDPTAIDQDWRPTSAAYESSVYVTSDDSTSDSQTVDDLIPAGTTVFILAQQWPDAYGTDTLPLMTPVTDWDPATMYGSWTGPSDSSVVLAALVPVGGGDGGFAMGARADETYYIRAYPIDGSPAEAGLTLSWTTVDISLNMRLIDDVMNETPGTLTASIWEEAPDSTVDFYLDAESISFQQETLDETGNSLNFALIIPLLTGASHSITAVSSTGVTATVTFTVVTGDPTEEDPNDTPPDEVASPTFTAPPVNRWRLSDPTNGTYWDFPINPKEVDSPTLPRVIASHVTTSPIGQAVLFEGARRAKPWTVRGSLFTLADVDALAAWVKKPWRVYITDDFQRTYLVLVERLQTVPVRDTERPENHTFILTMQLFGRITPGSE